MKHPGIRLSADHRLPSLRASRALHRLLTTAVLAGLCLHITAQRQVLFNDDWLFTLEGNTQLQQQHVTLPHDWSIGLPTDRRAPMGNDGGHFVAGKGKYMKTFTAKSAWKGKRNWLCFEGVYMNCRVVLNGKQVAEHAYGWTPFEADITEALRYDAENVLEVYVDNSRQKNCRWYTGSGIYRNVWVKTLPMTDAIGDYAVHTTKQGSDYRVDVDCRTAVTARLTDPDGRTVAEGQLPLTVPSPREWSPQSPALYTLHLRSTTDEVATRIGFRTIEYSAEKGLLLNGKSIELSGACVHSDNGALGACAYKGAETRRVKLLKEAGFNAVRTSHNPASTAFLDACDSLGLLVIDELYDGWRTSKTTYDYATLFDDHWKDDVDAFVRRDVNHPSIWCWSIGNEVIERTEPECVMTARRLAGRIHSLDPYRPVTSAMCSWGQGWSRFDTLMAEHDICGYNYYLHEAENDHQRVPSRVVMQTESYPRDAVRNWQTVTKHPYVIGDFVWTGIDYLGESGIGRYYYEGQTPGEHWERDHYPWHGAYCGDIDLLGWRKPISYLRDLLYNRGDGVHIGVREPDGYYGTIKETSWSVWPTWERWTWRGWEGRPIDVEVYCNATSVRLYLNDHLVAEQPVADCTARFSLPYQPGTLRAEAFADGRRVGTAVLRTAGKPAKVILEKDEYPDLTFVTATVVDRHGTPVPTPCELTFTANSEILATASACLTDTIPYNIRTRATWNGMAQAIVRTTERLDVKATFRALPSANPPKK
ncbi:MAG: DUF4982 domain-containing protein [Bacteroidaceae bacterium]|nr:DUF4982 domain-containing protein [Bacteroidaceae bacterium]